MDSKQLNQTLFTRYSVSILLINAVIITCYLFYLDEGNFNFKWMLNIGSWIVFIPYAAVFFFSQFIVSKFVFRKQKGMANTLWSVTIGGFGLAAALIFIFAK